MKGKAFLHIINIFFIGLTYKITDRLRDQVKYLAASFVG